MARFTPKFCFAVNWGELAFLVHSAARVLCYSRRVAPGSAGCVVKRDPWFYRHSRRKGWDCACGPWDSSEQVWGGRGQESGTANMSLTVHGPMAQQQARALRLGVASSTRSRKVWGLSGRRVDVTWRSTRAGGWRGPGSGSGDSACQWPKLLEPDVIFVDLARGGYGSRGLESRWKGETWEPTGPGWGTELIWMQWLHFCSYGDPWAFLHLLCGRRRAGHLSR